MLVTHHTVSYTVLHDMGDNETLETGDKRAREEEKEEEQAAEDDSLKITVEHVGRGLDKKKWDKVLKAAGVEYRASKKHHKSTSGRLSFFTLEQKAKAVEILKTMKGKGDRQYEVSDFVAERVRFGDRGSNHGDQRSKKKQKKVHDEEDGEDGPASCPWVAVPYEEQLERKQKEIAGVLKKITTELEKAEKKSSAQRAEPWLKERKAEFKATGTSPDAVEGTIPGACCRLERILHGKETTGYRNKCEFAIGKNADDKITVGFRAGGFKDGNIGVESCKGNILVSDSMQELAAAFEVLVTNSKLPVYDLVKHTGFWRQIMVRHFKKGKTMQMVVTINTTDLKEQVIQDEMKQIVTELTGEGKLYAGASLDSVGLFRNSTTGIALINGDELEILHGKRYIHEELCGCRFAVSPSAFFQVNSDVAEILYDKVSEWAREGRTERQSTIIDVCCGTGTIGLAMAKKGAKCVVGVDCSEGAIEDAKNNAKENDMGDRARFVAAMVEDVLAQVLDNKFAEAIDEENNDLKEARKILLDTKDDAGSIAIVDPPRTGLHYRVIRELRNCPTIRRLVYVSCNPTGSFIRDVVGLCRRTHKQRPGTPFYPIKAVPVDLFPHTKHCEIVMVLERVESKEEESKQDESTK